MGVLRVSPVDVRPDVLQLPGLAVNVIEKYSEQCVRCQRRSGMVGVFGVPPHASAARSVPSLCCNEVKRALGVVEVTMLPGGGVCVEEREPQPAVVVKPGLRSPVAVVGVRRVSVEVGIPEPLGGARELVDQRQMRRRGVGDLKRVGGLEHGHLTPDGQQGVRAVGAGQVFAVPTAGTPACRLGHPVAGQLEVVNRRRVRQRHVGLVPRRKDLEGFFFDGRGGGVGGCGGSSSERRAQQCGRQ